ncbi:N-alpha-acetyltransferase 40 [Phlebotomus argentipes]|uniref:N-alpha-acetyltransferase 40 n=1 Tax=Phlebotomus argentipes TaxID=94469 RepID=UPI002892BAB2|nr:N-alpha-acetyltransferase 40 [Phlebotomus argentipes]
MQKSAPRRDVSGDITSTNTVPTTRRVAFIAGFSGNYNYCASGAERKMVELTVKERQQKIAKACNASDALESLSEMFSYTRDDFRVRLRAWRKAEIPQKTLKWAIKLAERNVGPFYSSCSLGWQPKIKQADLNKHWARYLIAYTEDGGDPVAYCMFRFDMDHGRSVLYCYEAQLEESARRKGLGSHMMRILECAAAQWHMEKVVLTVLKNNPSGMNFFRKIGYSTDETSPGREESAPYEILSKDISA